MRGEVGQGWVRKEAVEGPWGCSKTYNVLFQDPSNVLGGRIRTVVRQGDGWGKVHLRQALAKDSRRRECLGL